MFARSKVVTGCLALQFDLAAFLGFRKEAGIAPDR